MDKHKINHFTNLHVLKLIKRYNFEMQRNIDAWMREN